MHLSNKHVVICVPIVETHKEEIIEDVKTCVNMHVACIEWRMDYFEQVGSIDAVLQVLQTMRTYLKDTMLIATFRTIEEGGEMAISEQDYVALLQTIDQSGLVDYIDVEGYSKPQVYEQLKKQAKTNYIVSYHNFTCIPNNLYDILTALKSLDANVVKVACMPQTEQDVEALKQVIDRFVNEYDGLLIAIAMGALGVETRLDPLHYHSCLTFASLNKTSAPGQLSYEELKKKVGYL